MSNGGALPCSAQPLCTFSPYLGTNFTTIWVLLGSQEILKGGKIHIMTAIYGLNIAEPAECRCMSQG